MGKGILELILGFWRQSTQNEWPYLQTEASKDRVRWAAEALREVPNIVEIGGYTTPVYRFLRGSHQQVWMIDPRARSRSFQLKGDGGRAEVRVIQSFFQNVDLPFAPGTYGLVLLGCSLKFKKRDKEAEEKVWSKLREWTSEAQTIILEFATDWENAIRARNTVESVSGIQLRQERRFQLPIPESVDPRFGERIFLVYESNRFRTPQ